MIVGIVVVSSFLQPAGAAEANSESDTAADDVSSPPLLNVFETSAVHGFQQVAVQHFRAGRFEASETLLRRVVKKYPQAPVPHYLLASLLARFGKTADALASLRAAVDRGFRGIETLDRDPYLASLYKAPEFAELLDTLRERAATEDPASGAAEIEPAVIENGVALVGLNNTIWDPRITSLRTFFRFTQAKSASEIVDGGTDAAAVRLNTLYARGQAAGNHGDLCDNRDTDHSNLPRDRLRQLIYVEYAQSAQDAGIHHGLSGNHFFNAITFGNSSTALVGNTFWRSQGRLALTDGTTPRNLFRQYSGNHLYLYPEHRDHDPEHGDVFPANTPYFLMSQGSSGSDQPFLRAVGSILAAFQPNVKAFLRSTNLVMPTVQMILRRGQKSVLRDQDYLSGRAHPSAFQASEIDLVRMIDIANSLTIDEIPPVVLLQVVEESQPRIGVESFGPHSEWLFDTPAAVARVVRSTSYQKRLVIKAVATEVPGSPPLRFHWVVLRGDADRIQISARNDERSEVEITVPWHERRAVPGRPELTTDRVDIGVFVYNGRHYSAPSFISLLYPAHQKRDYDAAHRITRVDYRDPTRLKRYVDPILFVRRNWTDSYEYDPDGRLVGWRRTGNDRDDRFTRHGAKVVEIDALGRPTRAQKVAYLPVQTRQGWRELIETPVGQFLNYDYADASDRLGALRE